MGPLRERRAWVFDLDGTLTVAVHDFDAMRRRLGFAPGTPILDGLAALAPAERTEAERIVAAWEIELAEQAVAAPGAAELLDALRAAGRPLGIVTRNTRDVALRTLAVAGLADRIPAAWVVGRHEARPKPAPDGVTRLLRAFGTPPGAAVMLGDHVDDARAGRAAGALAVLVRPDVPDAWRAEADHVVPDLPTLLAGERP